MTDTLEPQNETPDNNKRKDYLQLFNQRKEDGIAYFYYHLHPKACDVAAGILRDVTESKEIANDSILAVLDSGHLFSSDEGVEKYLLATVRNKSNDRLKALKKAITEKQGYNQFAFTNAREINWTFLANKFYSIYKDLPEDEKEIIQLAFVEKIKNKKIAEKFNVSEKHFATKKSRLTQKIKGLMGIKKKINFP